MSLLQRLRCALFDRHDVGRGTVRHDGEVARGRCRGCGIEMIEHRQWGWVTRAMETERLIAARRRQLQTMREATPPFDDAG